MFGIITDDWSIGLVALVNAVLAWVSSMVHGWAATNTSGKLRLMFIAISGLALFYSITYWWLYFNPERVEDWSNFLRPFGIVTWVVAWSVEPVILVLYLRKRGNDMIRRAHEMVEKAEARLQQLEDRDVQAMLDREREDARRDSP